MPRPSQAPLAAVARYYEGRVHEFGATPWGVDWTCELTQRLRFVQLLKIAGRRRRFSLNDLGCGYGALLVFLQERYGRDGVDYAGADIAPGMIRHAHALHGAAAPFVLSSSLPRVADFSVASGVFNVHLGTPPRQWRSFVSGMLRELHRASRIGFAVNFLQPPQPGLVPLEGLYRCEPAPWAAYCERTFRAEVSVLQDYGLREFTLLVRRPGSFPAARRAASGPVRCSRTAP